MSWAMLPPLERVCVSQVCRDWRRVSLASPRLWTQVIFLSTPWDGRTSELWPNVRERSKWDRKTIRNVFNPSPRSNNLAFFEELLSRSGQLPLDVTVLPPERYLEIKQFSAVLGAHAHRITRLHFRYCMFNDLELLLRKSGPLPALRTLTAGFDDRDVVYDHRPHQVTGTPQLPALRQAHFGADANVWGWDWKHAGLSSIDALTIVPEHGHHIVHALSSCPNLSSLTLVMSSFSEPWRTTEAFRMLTTRVQAVCVCDMHKKADVFIFELLCHPRSADITFDCRGHAAWSAALPVPFSLIEQPIHLTVGLKDGSYELDVVDSAQRRRRVFLEKRSIGTSPPLWPFWLRTQTVSAAVVDACAWSYFITGVPASPSISDLTVVVRADPSELDAISLAQLSSLERLHIDAPSSGLRFPRGAVSNLVCGVKLRILSLTATAAFEDVEELSSLAKSLEII
ncbi:hypothetical protein AURDEDRAFT_173936 [Auricularia subglabra TFB-10046 SS5]|uniref:F-box domain-containing protein n=1 Tax=Auricularia subglabra (strain TFB-10046 / SS5) TaxID=717982 RepID=J0WTS8_AURST|nr:hypothetical protein AURDEDRAFT_173936 [Auricularia subglabra TFB-10046 SS5]